MRQQVVELKCGRCARVEYVKGDVTAPSTLEVSLTVKGEKTIVKFDDLCEPCLKTVSNHLEHIQRKMEGLSPKRGAVPPPKEPPKEAPKKVDPRPPSSAKG